MALLQRVPKYAALSNRHILGRLHEELMIIERAQRIFFSMSFG
jgi:hypothetical protein